MSDDFQEEAEFAPLECVLWFDSAPSVDNPLLFDVLDDAFPHLEDHGEDGLVITHESLIHVEGDGVPLWGATVLTTPPAPAKPSLAQTWTWAGAGEALESARGVMVLRERLRGWVDPPRRIAAFLSVLEAVVEAMAPVALHWPAADLVTDPASVETSGFGFFNVRRQPSPEDPEGWVVDTVGLEALNIPDLECHFRDLPLDAVCELVAEHAQAFIAGTEFIGDGDPVMLDDDAGFGGELWFTARWVQASTEPTDRRVVAFVPPPPHALGTIPERRDEDE